MRTMVGGLRLTSVPALDDATRYALAGASAVLIGFIVRWSYVGPADFPLNDGGLFYSMVQDLQRAGYALPSFASYNGGQVPFAYPPMGLYLAGLTQQLTGASLAAVFRVLPLIANTLSIAAFWGLLHSMRLSRVTIAIAVFVFALLPMGFMWGIMGGGVTRSVGSLFSIVTLHQVYLFYMRRSWSHAAASSLLLALTVLSHPEAVWFTVYSIGIFWLAYGRTRLTTVGTAGLVLGAIVATGPWWAEVISRHGPDVFLRPGTGWPVLAGVVQLATLNIGGDSAFPVFSILGLLGALACIGKRQFFFPAWLVAIFLLQPRAADHRATIALAALVAIGITDGLGPLLRLGPSLEGENRNPQGAVILQSAVTRRLLGVLLLCAALIAITGSRSILAALSRDEISAMQWVRVNTPADARFLIVTSDRSFVEDRTAEWFPVLADRVNVAAVQGYEWLPRGEFARRMQMYADLRRCNDRDVACLDEWTRHTETTFDHVYVAKRRQLYRPSPGTLSPGCCELQDALLGDLRYIATYDGPGATVYARRP